MKKASFLILSVFIFSHSLIAYDFQAVKKAYTYLSKNWQYYNKKGKKISVRNLRYSCSGSNCKLIVNGRSRNPNTMYYLQSNKLVGIVKGQQGGQLSNQQVQKLDPTPQTAKGNEPGRMKGFTDAHNRYRSKVPVANLVWDAKIARYARQWANYLKRKGCAMQHRPRSGRYKQKYGENLAWASGQKLDAYKVVKMWHDEKKDYNYQNNSCRAVCGHYTQVIWKASRHVGCAMASCGRKEIWVCNYDPPGNWVGQKPY